MAEGEQDKAAPARAEKKKGAEACLHCGLPVPPGSRHPGFCCPGCEAVYGILKGQDLGTFYELGGGRGQPVGAAPRPSVLDWLPALEREGRLQGSLTRVQLDIQGIHCAACVWVLQKLWNRLPGALQIQLNPGLGQVDLSYDRAQLDLRTWIHAVESLGYRLGPRGRAEEEKEGERRQRGLLWRLGICAALSMNAMMFAFSYYFGLDPSDPQIYGLFRWISFGLATLAVLVGGPVFFKAAFAGLKNHVLHLDLPIALGILLAYGGSVYWFLARGDHSYFDTVTIFITLMLLGRWLQERAITRNRRFLLKAEGIEKLQVRKVEGERLETVPALSLEKGDLFLGLPGDLVPVDALLLDGEGLFSLDWIAGESEPRRFREGEEVPAGSFVRDPSPRRLEVRRGVEESGLLRLLRPEASPFTDDRGKGFWNLLSRVYVLGVLGLAFLGAMLWAYLDPSRSLDVAISILVVTCPCALGLAIPLGFDLGMARLRGRGIFVRSGDLLDRIVGLRRVFFDKTGTLTWGGLIARPLGEVGGKPGEGFPWAVLYTMARSSLHPVSAAISERVPEEERRFLSELRVREELGEGLEAELGGTRYRLGRPGFAGEGEGECLFTREGELLAAFRVEEDLRSGYEEALEELGRKGLEVWILSGDHPDKVQAAAKKLGIPEERALGGLRPEAKAELVRRLDQGRGLMLGDGLNDALAFREASAAGTPAIDRPVLPEACDFFYLGGGGNAVSDLFDVAVGYRKIVRWNLWAAGIYNGVAVTLCLMGLMSPLLCAILMPASSLVLLGRTWAKMRDPGRTQ
ncbi:MAG TPA: heavy metal translocating P-type ATPase [Planctomycetes bacterium]|nr:heavy metal translocating P-type ATPase [Planctomycetota bacterium]